MREAGQGDIGEDEVRKGSHGETTWRGGDDLSAMLNVALTKKGNGRRARRFSLAGPGKRLGAYEGCSHVINNGDYPTHRANAAHVLDSQPHGLGPLVDDDEQAEGKPHDYQLKVPLRDLRLPSGTAF